jgi:hypothetical protein
MVPRTLHKISPLRMAAVGIVLVVGSIVSYQIALGTSSVIGANNIGMLEETAIVSFTLTLLGLVFSFVGATRHLLQAEGDSMDKMGAPLARLSRMISEKRSLRIFTIASLSYGLLFGVASSTLVFQPGLSFSDAYGVGVPSVVPVLCCGPVGQMPQWVVYLTQQFAIIIVPMNLILLFAVSWLVGLNAAIASYTYRNRPEAVGARWVAGLGAAIGLFTVCPTCAGFFFLTLLGLGGAVALALTLSSLQAAFISIGIPILLVVPYLSLRGTIGSQACAIKNELSSRTGEAPR